MSEASEQLTESVSLEGLIAESRHVEGEGIAEFAANAAAVQIARHRAGASTEQRLTRSTALWVLGETDDEIDEALRATGYNGAAFGKLLDAEVPSVRQRGTVELHEDFADALRSYFEDAGYLAPIGLADLAQAILESARDSSRGLLPDRMKQIGVDPADAAAAMSGVVSERRKREWGLVDAAEFSSSVLGARRRLGPWRKVSAAEIAIEIQETHAGYADGKFAEVSLAPATEPSRATDEWLAAVKDLYATVDVASTRHQVIDGELVLLALADLEPSLAEAFQQGGFLGTLAEQVEALPVRAGSGRSEVERELLFRFARDVVDEDADIQAGEDQLGIEDDVRALCRLVAARSTHPPLAIGLFGDWGTGKSFFMRRMRTRLKELQAETRETLDQAVESPYHEHVVQIPFNAWHYIDTNLWASLMTRILAVLSGEERADARQSLVNRVAEARQRRNEADAAAVAMRHEREAVQRRRDAVAKTVDDLNARGLSVSGAVDALRAADRELDLPTPWTAAEARDDLAALGEEEDVQSLRELVGDTRSSLALLRRAHGRLGRRRWWWLGVLVFSIAAVGLFAAGMIAPGMIGLALTASSAWRLAASIGTGVGAVRSRAAQAERLIGALEDRRGHLETLSIELRQREQALAVEARTAALEVDDVRFESLVRQYARLSRNREAYERELGVISLIRADLEALANALAQDRASKTERIVLYIDDLDRCPPDRVVEVLQAVHLLLAFELFVVVVAVDPRWLLTALETHYRNILGRDEGESELDEWAATPADYVEKIFQIPIALSPMEPDSYEKLIESLTRPRRRRSDDGRGAAGVGATQDAGRQMADESDPRAAPDVPANDAAPTDEASSTQPLPFEVAKVLPPASEVADVSVAGEAIGLGFEQGGRDLIIATTEGVWRRSPNEVDRLETRPTSRLAFSADRSEVGWVCDDDVVVFDTATGHRRTITSDGGEIQHLRLGPRSDDVVIVKQSGLVEFWRSGALIGRTGFPGAGGSIVDVQFARDGEHLLVLTDGGGSDLVLSSCRLDEKLSDVRIEMLRAPSAALAPRSDVVYSLAVPLVARHRIEDPAQSATPADEALMPSIGGAPWSLVGATSDAVWAANAEGDVVRWAPAGGLAEMGRISPSVQFAAQPGGAACVLWSEDRLVVVEEDTPVLDLSSKISHAALSTTGRLLATSGGGKVQLWRVSGAAVGESPEQLDLDDDEIDFLVELAPLVPTARAAKRLVNIYRLLRASRRGRERLSDPATRDYQAALVLLALVVGSPALGSVVLRRLGQRPDGDWLDVLSGDELKRSVEGLDGDHAIGPGRMPSDVDDTIEALCALARRTPEQAALYVDWAPHIQRFSVLARPDLAGSTARPDASQVDTVPAPDNADPAT